MNYLSLYKAHFKIDINEKELYDIRFHSPNTLHFKVPIHNKESFLYLNNELLILIEQIHVLNSKIIKKRNKIKTDRKRVKKWQKKMLYGERFTGNAGCKQINGL